eukprot:3758462-Amphidinium_carterae.2
MAPKDDENESCVGAPKGVHHKCARESKRCCPLMHKGTSEPQATWNSMGDSSKWGRPPPHKFATCQSVCGQALLRTGHAARI